MSKTGYKSVSVTSYDTLKFTWTETSTDATANTSTVSWKLELISTSDGRISSTSDKDWKVVFNGVTYKGTNTVGISSSSTKTLASKSGIKVSHNSDGSSSVSYSFSQEFGITFGGSYIGTKSGSGTATLTTLARGSTISTPSTGTLGTAQTLKITKHNSSYYHIIKAVGSKGGSQTVCSRTQSTSVTWTPSISAFAKYETTSKTLSIKLTIDTYANSSTTTKIASSTITAKYTIPSSCSPTINSFSYSDVNNYSSKDSTLSGVYMIKTLSKLKYTAKATGKQGATIKTMQLKYGSVTASATIKSTTNSDGTTTGTGTYTSGSTWTYANNQTATLTVTDTRGYTVSKTYTIKSADYSLPTISKLNAHRTSTVIDTSTSIAIDSTEVVDDILGINSYIVVSCKVFTPTNSYNNKMTLKVTYKGSATNSTSKTDTITLSGDDLKSLSNKYIYIPINDDADAYAIKLTVTDIFGKTATSSTSVSSAFCLIHFNENGQSMALGKICSTDEPAQTLEIGFQNVVAKGSSWANLKISSGFRAFDGLSVNTPKIKRFGGVVDVRGVLEPSKAIETSETGIVIATGIPENMRPTCDHYYMCQGSAMNRWMLGITTDGELKIYKYGVTEYETLNAYTDSHSGSWLGFSAIYII